MKIKICFLALSLASLTACGGSSIGSTTVETLWKSPRNTGAGLVRGTANEINSVAIVEDVNNAGKYRSFEIEQVISETYNSDGSYSGEVVVKYGDGTRGNVLGRFYNGAALYVSSGSESTSFVAGGEQASNLPIGSYTYSGYAESIYVYGGTDYNEVGSFAMDVQFGNRTAQLNAATPESAYSIGSLSINNNGEINGSNGTFTVFDNDGTTELERRSIDFDGTFHSSGATHVSGIAVGGASTTDDFSIMAIVGRR